VCRAIKNNERTIVWWGNIGENVNHWPRNLELYPLGTRTNTRVSSPSEIQKLNTVLHIRMTENIFISWKSFTMWLLQRSGGSYSYILTTRGSRNKNGPAERSTTIIKLHTLVSPESIVAHKGARYQKILSFNSAFASIHSQLTMRVSLVRPSVCAVVSDFDYCL
jgi:hypothetical protein